MTSLELIVVTAGIALVMLRFAPAIADHLVPSLTGAYVVASDFCHWSVGRFRRIACLTCVSGVLAVIMAGNVYLFSLTGDLPDLDSVINYRPKQIGYFYDGRGGTLIEIADLYREPVSYAELPEIVRHATIAAEDKRYYTRLHTGIDFIALPRVIWKNWNGNTQGGSGITQQVTKNQFLKEELERERLDELLVDNFAFRQMERAIGTYWTNKLIRKTIEGKISVNLEPQMTDYFERSESAHGLWDLIVDGPRSRARLKMKNHLLEIYCNDIYLGRGAYGYPYASRKFFGKSIHEIELHEAALLASFIPFPGPYSSLPEDPVKREVKLWEMKGRRDMVLGRMYRAGFISETELTDALAEPVDIIEPRRGSKTVAPAAVNLALTEVKEMGIEHSLITSGFAHPHLTIDPAVQDAVNHGVEVGIENFKVRWPDAEVPQYAVIVLKNDTAEILGISGGRLEENVHNYADYNRATMAVRQPGSTFKGINALAAIINGVTPESIFDDKPYCINMGRGRGYHCVSNFDGRFKGSMNFREIIAQSRNTATLHMVDSLTDESKPDHKGIDEVIYTARLLGISTRLDRYTVTALGSNGVIPLEFANAYRAIASGITAKPHVVHRVTDERGNVLVEYTDLPRPLPVSPVHLRTVQELLRGTVLIPGGTGGALRNFHVPCAGKTGTSNDHKDAWFVCFTYGQDGITVLAWVGYDSFGRSLPHKGRPRATGGTAALPFVRGVLDGCYGENKPLGEPPAFPDSLERNIREYIYWTRTFPLSFQ